MTLVAERAPLRVETLRVLVQAPGPWTSIYIGLADRDPQGQPVKRSARWHALATVLFDQGAPADVVAAIGGAVAGEPPGPAVLAAFAAENGPVTLFRVPRLFEPDAAGFGPLPRVLPLLGWLQEHLPHVVVITDRTGADVEVVGLGGQSRRWTVAGPDDEIERNAPGGWAQARYQRRAEDSWAHNAARVADAVTTAVRETDARLVVVAGDVRAVQLLEDHLPEEVGKKVTVRHITGGRSPDGSQHARSERVDEVVQEVADEHVVALLGRFAQERAPGGAGVEGAPETVAALARGEVAALLLVPGMLEGRWAWFGALPSSVLAEGDELPPADWGPAVRAPLVDVAVRAALGTRGDVWLVPDGLIGSPAEGIGAFCRFPRAAAGEEGST